MQRLMALRQDVGDGTSRDELAAHLDRTIAETRAIISVFHPASVRALGFEASLRAAVEPFPGCGSRRAHSATRPSTTTRSPSTLADAGRAASWS